MGSVFRGPPKPPKPPAPPPPPPVLPEKSAPEVIRSRANERRRALAGGRSSTILTGSQGLTDTASTTKKTLLGQ